MIDVTVVRAYLIVWGLLTLGVRTVYLQRASRRKARAGSPHTNPHPLVVASMGLWIALIAAFVIAPDIVTDSRLMLRLPAPWIFQGLGLILLATGLWLLIRAHQALGDFFGVRLFVKEAHRVIDAGPYAYIRHPMYTAYVLWIAATALMLPHAGVFLLFLMALIGFHRMAKGEERMLCAALGAQYRAYLGRTGMFFPKRS